MARNSNGYQMGISFIWLFSDVSCTKNYFILLARTSRLDRVNIW